MLVWEDYLKELERLVVKDDMQLEYSATPAAIAICFYVLDVFILLHLRLICCCAYPV